MKQERGADEERTHYSYVVSLRLSHPTIDPNEITKRIGIEPKRRLRVGEPRTTAAGRPLPGTNDANCWVGQICDGDFRVAELAVVFGRLLDGLSPHKAYFHSFRKTGGRIEFFVGWFFDHNSGDVFSFSLLQKFADLQIDLSLDVYEPITES